MKIIEVSSQILRFGNILPEVQVDGPILEFVLGFAFG
jgi:hypothetical protein